MRRFSLTALAHQQLTLAQGGHSSHAVLGGPGHLLWHTLLAAAAGQIIHQQPPAGEATLQVLQGAVRLVVDADQWHGTAGDLLIVPRQPYSLHAVEALVLLLTVAPDRSVPTLPIEG